MTCAHLASRLLRNHYNYAREVTPVQSEVAHTGRQTRRRSLRQEASTRGRCGCSPLGGDADQSNIVFIDDAATLENEPGIQKECRVRIQGDCHARPEKTAR